MTLHASSKSVLQQRSFSALQTNFTVMHLYLGETSLNMLLNVKSKEFYCSVQRKMATTTARRTTETN